MTLEQLRVFVAVAERQHVTRAAEALNLAQSAASAAVAALETRHGVPLFHRVGRGISLTEAGLLFLDEARAVLARADQAERCLVDLGGLRRGVLAVKASQTIASYWLPRHLVDYHAAYPGIGIRLAVGNTAEVVTAVLSGSSELGFVEGLVEDARLTAEPVARDRLVVVVGAGHPWARAARVWPADLAAAEWVLREPGSGTRSVFEGALADLGVAAATLAVVMELPTNEAVRAAVEAGLGATALSASVAAPSLEAGLLVKIDLPLPERAFAVIRHRERDLSHAAAAFVGLVARTAPLR